MVILENIDIDIDKAILQNIDIDKISNRFKFGISNRATSGPVPVLIVFYSPLSVVSSFTCPQLCPLNCKNASTAVLPSVSGRIEYSL